MNKKLMTFVESIPGWLTIKEGSFLERSVKDTNRLNGAIVEIGSFCGKSTVWLSQHAQKVYAIDPHKGNVEEDLQFQPTYNTFMTNIKKAEVAEKVEPLVTTSQNAAKKWHKKIRVLFIDGLHDKENAQQDFRLWTPHLVDGGVIAVHDSFRRWCGSEKVAVKNIVWSSEFYKIGFVDSIIYGVKGKGTLADAIKKPFIQIFISVSVEFNHLLCILQMLKDSLKTPARTVNA